MTPMTKAAIPSMENMDIDIAALVPESFGATDAYKVRNTVSWTIPVYAFFYDFPSQSNCWRIKRILTSVSTNTIQVR